MSNAFAWLFMLVFFAACFTGVFGITIQVIAMVIGTIGVLALSAGG